MYELAAEQSMFFFVSLIHLVVSALTYTQNVTMDEIEEKKDSMYILQYISIKNRLIGCTIKRNRAKDRYQFKFSGTHCDVLLHELRFKRKRKQQRVYFAVLHYD